MSLRRGEIRWYPFAPPDKQRPVLVLTRDAVIDQLNEIIVAPFTRTTRGLATEVPMTAGDVMPHACVANLAHVTLAHRAKLGALIGIFDAARWPEVERALLVATGFLL
jgi:mRNA interferase MazF